MMSMSFPWGTLHAHPVSLSDTHILPPTCRYVHRLILHRPDPEDAAAAGDDLSAIHTAKFSEVTDPDHPTGMRRAGRWIEYLQCT